MSRNIYANTALDSPYPAYVSVNFPFDARGGSDHTTTDTVEITVRSPGKQGLCGDVAMMPLTKLEARKMAQAILDATD